MLQDSDTEEGASPQRRALAVPHPLLLASAGAGAPLTETGRLLLATDWAATPLGPVAGWPRSLRIAVSICLNSRFPMFVWWGPSLVNIYNDAYIPVLGQRHPQAFGQPARQSWSDIWDVVGLQADEVMVHGRASWNERVLLVMERNGYPEDTWFTWSYSPIHDDEGGIGGLFCACTEETGAVLAERERDRLVREAQDAAHTLRTWFDDAPGFVALLRGPRFVFELANKAYYQLVGHRDIMGRPVLEALPEVREQGFVELLEQVYRTGKPFVGRGMALQVQPQPGGPAVLRFVDFVFQPVHDADGQVAGIFAQGHDATEQVQGARALQDADRRKDDFLATLAHELRNPLAPIRQAALVARNDAPRQAWALGVIERQVGHMALLLDDLLDVSRISRGKLELRLRRVELREVVDAAVETVRPLLQAKRHQLHVRLPPGAAPLLVDPVRLAQVVSNLLSNAGKYTDAGGRIELEAGMADGVLTLRVRDNGIGLSAQDRPEIFEMFSQVASAIDRSENGLGIGLALTRGLVQLHGGRIDAASDGPGKGSEFIVTLPTRQPDQPAATTAADSAPAQPAAPRSRKVLLADDNADALETMAALLEIEGHVVQTATDGNRALLAGEQLRPDVAILDIGMPHLNGYEAAAKIRETDWGRSVVLIALTGWGQEQDQARAREAGFDHHCTKPVDIERLLQLVQGA
ncbi:MAG: putative histidine kinase, hybrid [Ramlibacter sp.]|uniref:hybrid sensor histidine kinase/response regulator n=1 Tax=Ramlibacter sp. TaxID=1917967 RepID=UPI0026192F1E|nr:ATP-binding protein [Ramlibacter sp.]MDB5751386.1 putative histidine kinase, hybrid [Ramlibacter sp.]